MQMVVQCKHACHYQRAIVCQSQVCIKEALIMLTFHEFGGNLENGSSNMRSGFNNSASSPHTAGSRWIFGRKQPSTCPFSTWYFPPPIRTGYSEFGRGAIVKPGAVGLSL